MPSPTSGADPRDSASPYGVLDFLAWDHDWNNHHYPPDTVDRAVSRLKELGAGWVRIDFLWQDIEPARGAFAFDKYDRLTAGLADAGIRILGVLHYNVDWASDRWNAPPDPALFSDFARAAVRRYKDRVKYWEIWNEPDHETYWTPQDGMKTYAALLARAAEAIRSEDPAARVVLGGLSAGLPKSLDQVCREGAREVFDVVNIHPFVNPLSPDALGTLEWMVDRVASLMESLGIAGRPIWITEIGCPGLPAGAAGEAASWWLGKSPGEAVQAGWLETVYGRALRRPGVEKIFWAFLRDTPGHFKDGVDYFGLLRPDFSPKPAFAAYQKVIQSFRRPGGPQAGAP